MVFRAFRIICFLEYSCHNEIVTKKRRDNKSDDRMQEDFLSQEKVECVYINTLFGFDLIPEKKVPGL